MQPVVLVPAGTGSGIITGRIGDFSGMSVDPVNGTFWHVNEFGGGGPTDIANFTPEDRPVVTAPSDQTAVEGAAKSFNVGSFADPDGGPWTVTVNWGDGSPNTTFNRAVAGSLGTQPHTYAEEGSYTVTVTVTDSTLLSGSKTFKINTSDPSVVATGGKSINSVEGASTGSVLLATFTDPGGPEVLADYSADIDWGDGTGLQVGAGAITLNVSTFEVRGSHTYAEESAADHPGSNPYQISITVHHELSTPQVVISTATVSDPAVVAVGGFTFTATEGVPSAVQTVATFTDPGGPEPLADYSALIDWGDGTPPSAGAISFAAGVFTVQGSHTYAVGLGLPDDFGDSFKDGLPPSYHKPIAVSISHEAAPVALAASDAVIAIPQGVAYVTAGNLIIVGTTHDDRVTIAKPVPGSLRVYADFLHNPGFATFNAADVSKIVAFLLLGDDTFIINSNVTTPAIAHGGPGKDLLKAGGGPSVLLGDQGDDRLIGGDVRDIIIGGIGADLLMGGLGEDILIGGTTAYDFHHKALMDLITEWNAPDSFNVRTDRLATGTGPTGVQLAKGVTVFDDTSADLLVGSFGSNWLFFDALDATPDKKNTDRAN
jgi:hypothetical protein